MNIHYPHLCTILLLGCSLSITEADAHPGKRDVLSCHNDRKAGEYHCHDKAMEQIDVLATQSIILTIQKGLKHNGFTIKKADGFMNKQTRDALFDYAKNKKMKIPETLDGDFMRHLAESLK